MSEKDMPEFIPIDPDAERDSNGMPMPKLPKFQDTQRTHRAKDKNDFELDRAEDKVRSLAVWIAVGKIVAGFAALLVALAFIGMWYRSAEIAEKVSLIESRQDSVVRKRVADWQTLLGQQLQQMDMHGQELKNQKSGLGYLSRQDSMTKILNWRMEMIQTRLGMDTNPPRSIFINEKRK